MKELEPLIEEARELLDETPGSLRPLIPEAMGVLTRRLAVLREKLEGATLHLPDHAAAGYLADAAAAMQLVLRAIELGDQDRLDESREQAEYYLAAAEQAVNDTT